MMHRFVVIRSLVGAGGEHSAGQCLTGYNDLISKAQGGRPSLGAVVSRLQGPIKPDVPPYVGLSPRTGEPRWVNPSDGQDAEDIDRPEIIMRQLEQAEPDELRQGHAMLGVLLPEPARGQ
jgi:hypothetical protein